MFSRPEQSKETVIAWWISVFVIVILAYRRATTDFAYIFIAVITAILALLAFTSFHGSSSHVQLAYTLSIVSLILAIIWTIVSVWIPATFSCLIVICMIVPLVPLALLLESSSWNLQPSLYALMVLLVALNLITTPEIPIAAVVVAISVQILALYLLWNNANSSGLLTAFIVVIIGGLVIGLV